MDYFHVFPNHDDTKSAQKHIPEAEQWQCYLNHLKDKRGKWRKGCTRYCAKQYYTNVAANDRIWKPFAKYIKPNTVYELRVTLTRGQSSVIKFSMLDIPSTLHAALCANNTHNLNFGGIQSGKGGGVMGACGKSDEFSEKVPTYHASTYAGHSGIKNKC
jgi:hypothetical protein